MVEEKECRSCGLKIPESAKLCHHCDSFQNWRRHLDFGQTSLSLLIALFSVIGLAASPVKELIEAIINEKAEYELSAAISEIDPAHIEILVANEGLRTIAFDTVVCSIYPPLDGVMITSNLNPRKWQRLTGAQVGPELTYVYRSNSSIWSPGSQGIWRALSTAAVSVPSADPPRILEATEEALSYCFIFANKMGGGEEATWVEIKPSFTNNFKKITN